jgi:GrpB-like predicted nucleotidyltransferase (UPF0157 family)
MCYFVERADPAVDKHLLLRDHFRSQADERFLDESTKKTLSSKRWDNTNGYADAKADVILAVKERVSVARGY